MLANNLDVMNLAILEHQELLRRHRNDPVVVDRPPTSPWTALRSLVSRIFGVLGGEPVVTIAGGSVDRPVPLTLVHLPATVIDEARERAA